MPELDSVCHQGPKVLECAASADSAALSHHRLRRLPSRTRAASWALTTALFALSSLSSGAVLASQANTVKIGLLLPPEEPQAVSLREGVLLASEQASNAATAPFEIIIRGRVGQWGADGVEAARMVTDDGVEALIAPPDGAASHLTLQVSGRTAVPVVTLCADSSVGRTGVPWMLRIVPRTIDEAKALFACMPAKVADQTNRWVALVPTGRAGREISRDLRQAALACGAGLVKVVELSPSASNGELVRSQVLGSRADAVLVWLDPSPAGKEVKALKTAGYQGLVTGPGWLQCSDFINSAGDALEGFIVPTILRNDDSTARWQSFQASYQQRWGRPPALMSAMAYDAAMLLNHLLRQPEFQVPPHRLAPGFSQPGVTGALAFDPEGNREVKLRLLCFKNGGFIPAAK